eukprot:1178585-Prorocentrum_minimum.AAC.3
MLKVTNTVAGIRVAVKSQAPTTITLVRLTSTLPEDVSLAAYLALCASLRHPDSRFTALNCMQLAIAGCLAEETARQTNDHCVVKWSDLQGEDVAFLTWVNPAPFGHGFEWSTDGPICAMFLHTPSKFANFAIYAPKSRPIRDEI